jgi:hypothetical protein
MIFVTCGKLEGTLVCLCISFLGESLIVEAQGYLKLHWGMKPTGWIMRPLSLDTWEEK